MTLSDHHQDCGRRNTPQSPTVTERSVIAPGHSDVDSGVRYL